MSLEAGAAAAGVTVASLIQAYVALNKIRETETDVIEHWGARDELLSEVRWWRPIKRFRRGREVRRLIDRHQTPAFRSRFRRVRLTLLSWSVLVVSSGYGAFLAFRG